MERQHHAESRRRPPVHADGRRHNRHLQKVSAKRPGADHGRNTSRRSEDRRGEIARSLPPQHIGGRVLCHQHRVQVGKHLLTRHALVASGVDRFPPKPRWYLAPAVTTAVPARPLHKPRPRRERPRDARRHDRALHALDEQRHTRLQRLYLTGVGPLAFRKHHDRASAFKCIEYRLDAILAHVAVNRGVPGRAGTSGPMNRWSKRFFRAS